MNLSEIQLPVPEAVVFQTLDCYPINRLKLAKLGGSGPSGTTLE